MRAGRGVGLALPVFLGAVVTVNGGAADAGRAAAVEDLPSRVLAGQRLIAGFEGRRPSPDLRRMISRGDLAGVILFSGNVGGRRAVRRLTRRLQAIPRPVGVSEPLLVMVDQEGGLVRRLPGPPKPAAAVVGRRGGAFAQTLGAATGNSLRDMGVNVNLAPVLDLARPGGFIARQRRSYGRKAGRVAAVGVGFATGLERAGVAATAKHFPGLGMAGRSTDDGPVGVRTPLRRLRRSHERPFARFAATGGDLVMLSMATYRSLAGHPAALSRAVATRELRGRLGFSGVSITDDLDTPAGAAIGGPGRLARLGARAGTDLLLFSDLRAARRAGRALRRGLRSGGLDMARFERSVARVLALREELEGPA